MIEKRKFLRVPYKAPVYGEIKFVSELQDISINGCFVTTTTPLAEGTLVDIEFTLPNTSRIIRTSGDVRWFGRYSSDRRAEGTQGVGIKFIDISLEDIATISEFVKNQASHRRRTERSRIVVPIRYGKIGAQFEFTGTAVDLSLGGLFIKGERMLDLDSHIQLELNLPGANRTMTCQGKVVYINENIPEIFRGLIEPGMGIEFIEIKEPDLDFLDKYLEAALAKTESA